MGTRLEIAFAVVVVALIGGYFGWRLRSAESPADSPRDEFLRVAAALEASDDPILGTAQVTRLRKVLAEPGLAPARRLDAHYDLCAHLLRLGDTAGAVAEIDHAQALAEQVGLTPRQGIRLHARRALVFLRLAEIENCVKRHNADCCIFPLAGGGVHKVNAPALEARRSLMHILESQPDNRTALWLLNIVAMALGEHPDGVPEQFRVPPDSFRSEHGVGRFKDIAPRLGVDTFDQCGGVIVGDFDGDDRLDIVTSTLHPRGPLTYYHNAGDDGFEDRSEASGLDQQLGGLNCIGADYDNDGDKDILVLRGAWLGENGRIRNSLVRNNGDGTFTDVTRAAGLATPMCPTQAAAWFDYDNDGDLDLYVGNESVRPKRDYPSQLFRNNGDGTFTDVATAAGVSNDRFAKAVTVGDYDNDGDLDLYVSNYAANRMYRNDGDGAFTDVAEELGVRLPEFSFAAWFFDYDNDGWLDLFVTAYASTLSDIVSAYMGRSHAGVSPRLYHNEKGRFRDVTAEFGLDRPMLPMGANFGDLDNDGYLDVYLATGDPGYETLTPNVMLRNDRGRRFQDVTTSGGFGHLQKGHGVAFADIDGDGDQDIYNQLGGFYPGDRFHNALLRNPGHGNRFVVVRLVGRKTNRDGIGARVRVFVEGPSGRAVFHRAVGSVSSFGGSPFRQEIGLGNAERIERIEIDWPTSRTTQVVTGVPLDARVRITEGEDGHARMD